MGEACFLYVTAGDDGEARRIAAALVEERLAACVNIHAPITSIYRWEGTLQQDEEIVLIVKTRRDAVARATERILALHSYDCPCVVSLPIEDGHRSFIDWILEETADALPHAGSSA